jgi:hypothetical protein
MELECQRIKVIILPKFCFIRDLKTEDFYIILYLYLIIFLGFSGVDVNRANSFLHLIGLAKIKKIEPDLSKLRKSLFWDTDIEKIDWNKHRQYVIERVMERGTEAEKIMINEFYGIELPFNLNK